MFYISKVITKRARWIQHIDPAVRMVALDPKTSSILSIAVKRQLHLNPKILSAISQRGNLKVLSAYKFLFFFRFLLLVVALALHPQGWMVM